MSKTARKTAGAFKTGDDPRRGCGKPGRSGRKPIEFLKECDRLTDELVLPKWEAHLRKFGPKDPAWRAISQRVADYSKGVPKQTVALEGTDKPLMVMSPLDDLARRLAGLAARVSTARAST